MIDPPRLLASGRESATAGGGGFFDFPNIRYLRGGGGCTGLDGDCDSPRYIKIRTLAVKFFFKLTYR